MDQSNNNENETTKTNVYTLRENMVKKLNGNLLTNDYLMTIYLHIKNNDGIQAPNGTLNLSEFTLLCYLISSIKSCFFLVSAMRQNMKSNISKQEN